MGASFHWYLGKHFANDYEGQPRTNEMVIGRKMNTRKENRIMTDLKQAAMLLRDKNLVWSADLDSIREDLALYLESAVISGQWQNPALQRIAQALIADENDLSI